MSDSTLRVQDLTAGYGAVDVLRGVSLRIPRGKVSCLLGANGAGKTTLMRILAGALRPSHGVIWFWGRDRMGAPTQIAGAPPHRLVAAGIALVPENRLVFGSLSVAENLKAGALFRRDRREVDADILDMTRRFPRLGERMRQRAGSLSGGEQQMLAIARALMSRPTLLLMDEPSLGLAPSAADDLFEMVAALGASGTSVLVAEQSGRSVIRIAHQVLSIERGGVRVLNHADAAPGAEQAGLCSSLCESRRCS